MSSSGDAEFLIEPRWLLPVAPGNTVLEGQAVAVGGGRILAVGPAAELRQRFATHTRIVRERHALLRGGPHCKDAPITDGDRLTLEYRVARGHR